MSFTDTAAVPPVSFVLDGLASAEFLDAWPGATREEASPGGALTRTRLEAPDGSLAVEITARRFDGFGAVEWVVEFENTGSAASGIIEDILPLDLREPFPERERLFLHHAKGSAMGIDDFLPITTEIDPPGWAATRSLELVPRGGRSSNGVLPFMNFQRTGGGMIVAVGWSGQWALHADRTKDDLRIRAGMEETHLRLQPGERIRTPRMLVLPWEGADADAGNNLLRRLLIAHYMPRIDGELVMPPSAQCLQWYFYLTGKASEDLEMAALPKVADIGAEAYWIDACWYGEKGEWWQQVGSWKVNREKFPRGLKPISDAAHEAGMKFVLWFEPERVFKGSILDREQPEFLLSSAGSADSKLLDLGNPDALRHITDLVSTLVGENGVDIYRQDFNIDPLPFWREADEPDRVGMSEIRYIEGLYRMWDDLRARHPAVWIDNCASGGRRIDLETMSRSLPLWPSDFPDTYGLSFGHGLSVGCQCINAGLARWVPLFGGGVWNFTPYSTRSQITGGFTFGCHIDEADMPAADRSETVSSNDVMEKCMAIFQEGFPMEAARAAIAEWRSLRHLFVGDFYLLGPLTVSYHDWCAWQLHREDLGEGAAMFFRRHESPFGAMSARLRCIDPEAQYDVTMSTGHEEGPAERMCGARLAALEIEIGQKPGSLLARYRKCT